MKKLTAFCILLFFAGTVEQATAQTSINNIRITSEVEPSSPAFIDGISFTPDGILQTTESGGTKSIKAIPAPVVTAKGDVMEDDNSSSLIERFHHCNLNMP